MKGILIVGHGTLPIAFEQAVKMMAGDISHVHSIGLMPEEGPEAIKNKLANLSEVLASYEEIKVFGDLFGGSPLNTVFQELSDQAHYTFISGMNFPMILTAALSLDSTVEELIKVGREEIKNVGQPEANVVIKQTPEASTQNFHSKEPQELIHVRVDSRGIHGQVATAWIPTLKVSRIIVIDDETIDNPTQKMALKMARPNHTKLSILSTDTAINRLKDPFSYPGEKILVLIQNIETLKTLAEKAFYFEHVNLGNVPNRETTTKYLRTIHLTPEEALILIDLSKKDTRITAQMVPNDPLVDFEKLLGK